MSSQENNLSLQLSSSYRAARRTNSILCALTIAWSAAQLDLKTFSLGFVGSVDLSQASIPLILFCVIAYSATRFILEFLMQCVEVRRWSFAQVDLKLSVYLVRITILVLAASGLSRSVETVFYVIFGTLSIIIVSSIAIFIIMMGLMPLLIYLRSHQGRYSVASRAFESMAWAELIVVSFLSILFIVLGFATYHYAPMQSLWKTSPNPFAMGFFVFTCIILIVSFYLQRLWYRKLFADPPDFTEETQADGSVRRIYQSGRDRIVWNWYSQSVKNEGSQKPRIE